MEAGATGYMQSLQDRFHTTGWPAEDAGEVASLSTPELCNSPQEASLSSCVDDYDVDDNGSLACRNATTLSHETRRGWHSYMCYAAVS